MSIALSILWRTAPLVSATLLALIPSAAAQTWTVVPSPNPAGATQVILRDVAVVAEDDVWAVGHWRNSAFQDFTLAMHWDGSDWTIVPTPSPEAYPGSVFCQLYAVEARASDDVWAAGLKNVPGQGIGSIGPQILVVHWDGTSWTEVPAPLSPTGNGSYAMDIVELSANDLLFVGVGFSAPLGGTRHPLAMHWDGSSYSIDPTPVVASGSTSHEYTAVAAVSPTEVFTAGRVGFGSGCGIPRILDRYDGQSWSTVNSPEPGWQHCFEAIEAVAADDVWAAGSVNGPSGLVVMVMHWDGSAWSLVPAPGGGASLLAFDSNDVLMGGSGIFQWDGSSWFATETFTGTEGPVVRAMDHVGAAGVWAVGQKGFPGQQTTFTAVRTGSPDSGSAVCFGDGSGLACPCGANGNLGAGCLNTTTTTGATLSASGSPNFSSDSFRLQVSGMPSAKAGLCIKGSAQLGGGNGILLGDGLLCTSPQLRSQILVSDNGGNATMGSWRGQPFGSYPGAANAGAATYYQWWYRDPSNSCSGQGFNFANAWEVTWQ